MTEKQLTGLSTLPLSICVQTTGGIATTLVRRGTPLPATRRGSFSTSTDAQEAVTISLYLGERPLTKNAWEVGTVEVQKLPPKPKGTLAIDLDVTARPDGKIEVVARCTQAKIEERSEFDACDAFRPENVDRVLRDAVENRLADQAHLAIVEAENAIAKNPPGDSQSEKLSDCVAELGLELERNDQESIGTKIDELRRQIAKPRPAIDPFFGGYADIFGPQSNRPSQSHRIDRRNAAASPPKSTPTNLDKEMVFLVHGRDEGTNQAVARVIERLVGRVIILAEQPNRGRTLIEKFESHARSAGFAVVLMTGDDIGGLKGMLVEQQRRRPRQNVVLELGFFLGSLGRGRVCALFEPGIEIPSDYDGVTYVPLEHDWRLQLARELRAAGFKIDLNRIL